MFCFCNFYNQQNIKSMKKFFVIIFCRFQTLLKDDFSAMAVVAYLLSLNAFTLIGYYKSLFQHSNLSKVPLFYAIIIMLLAGILTRFILLGAGKGKIVFKELKQSIIAKDKKGTWLTAAYIIGSFALMFGII